GRLNQEVNITEVTELPGQAGLPEPDDVSSHDFGYLFIRELLLQQCIGDLDDSTSIERRSNRAIVIRPEANMIHANCIDSVANRTRNCRCIGAADCRIPIADPDDSALLRNIPQLIVA